MQLGDGDIVCFQKVCRRYRLSLCAYSPRTIIFASQWVVTMQKWKLFLFSSIFTCLSCCHFGSLFCFFLPMNSLDQLMKPQKLLFYISERIPISIKTLSHYWDTRRLKGLSMNKTLTKKLA